MLSLSSTRLLKIITYFYRVFCLLSITLSNSQLYQPQQPPTAPNLIEIFQPRAVIHEVLRFFFLNCGNRATICFTDILRF